MTDAADHRVNALRRLLEGAAPLDETLEAIGALPWDSDEELVTLTPEHVIKMLERFLSGELTTSDLEQWANAIEGRDDIGLEPTAADALKEAIFDLANPSLQGSMTPASAQAWVTRIRSGSSRK
jgi:hypothetical protein